MSIYILQLLASFELYTSDSFLFCFLGPKLPEDRVRYWNAYLLFYERIPSRGGSGRRQSTRLKILRKSVDSPAARQDSLSELSDLVSQGEKQVRINPLIRDEKLVIESSACVKQ